MKENRGLFLTVEIICVFAILVCGFMMIGGDRFAKKYRIYAIVDESDNEDRQSLKSGMRSAAEDNSIELIIVGTDESVDTEDPENIILREKDNGNLDENIGIKMIELDNYSLGKSLGEALVSEFYEEIREKGIDIICKNKESETQGLRIDGLREILNKSGINKVNIIERDNIKGKEPNGLGWEASGEVIVAVDNNSLLAAGEYSAGLSEPPIVYGIGSSADSIYLLEKNYINGIILPDEYKIGYKSVELAVNKMRNKTKTADSLETEFSVITKDNLYSIENEGILMTLSR